MHSLFRISRHYTSEVLCRFTHYGTSKQWCHSYWRLTPRPKLWPKARVISQQFPHILESLPRLLMATYSIFTLSYQNSTFNKPVNSYQSLTLGGQTCLHHLLGHEPVHFTSNAQKPAADLVISAFQWPLTTIYIIGSLQNDGKLRDREIDMQRSIRYHQTYRYNRGVILPPFPPKAKQIKFMQLQLLMGKWKNYKNMRRHQKVPRTADAITK